MKKLLISTALISSLTIGLNADLLRVEVGGGVWSQTPSGTAVYDAGYGITGKNVFDEESHTSGYVWFFIKHPIPILPNIKAGFVNINANGKASGSWEGQSLGNLSSRSHLNLDEYDIIPYYNILDNTFWITIDFGLDFKILKSDYRIDPKAFFMGYEDRETNIIPLGYLKLRTEIPATNIAFETDGEYITYESSTIYDIKAKVDYTLNVTPLVQPALEFGYRYQKIKIDEDDSDVKSDVKFKGFYGGIMLRF